MEKRKTKAQKRVEEELENIYRFQKEITILEDISALIRWDEETYMPPEGVRDSAEKNSLINRLLHERLISRKLKRSVNFLLKSNVFNKLSEKDQLVTGQLQKDIQDALKLPVEFVEEFSKVTSEAYVAWQKAKKESKFEIFQPHLEKIVELSKQEANYKNLPGHPYNSLLDGYEEGMTVEKVTECFSYLRKELSELLKKVVSTEDYAKQKQIERLANKKYPQMKQAEIDQIALKTMGLLKGRSRLDVSTHPFTSRVGDNDIRITTHYSNNPLDTLSSTMHEAGHALYELGFPKEYKNTFLFQAPSLSMDEAQSRFWENMIGKSKSFWQYAFPIYKEKFPRQLKNVSFDKWFSLVNIVKPSFIRIEADELTYCLHIILRFEIEKGLIEGSIKVKDLPKIWNEKFEEMFGIKPKTDREGVLQDVQWSCGSIGYFPTYALGTIYAAQFYNQLLKDIPTANKEIKKGKLENVVGWLRNNVYKYGRTLTAEEITNQTCKEGLNPERFIEYLHNKYSKIYKFE